MIPAAWSQPQIDRATAVMALVWLLTLGLGAAGFAGSYSSTHKAVWNEYRELEADRADADRLPEVEAKADEAMDRLARFAGVETTGLTLPELLVELDDLGHLSGLRLLGVQPLAGGATGQGLPLDLSRQSASSVRLTATGSFAALLAWFDQVNDGPRPLSLLSCRLVSKGTELAATLDAVAWPAAAPPSFNPDASGQTRELVRLTPNIAPPPLVGDDSEPAPPPDFGPDEDLPLPDASAEPPAMERPDDYLDEDADVWPDQLEEPAPDGESDDVSTDLDLGTANKGSPTPEPDPPVTAPESSDL